MDNTEYLEAYIAWKDMVNTEDVDTPERFAVYLESVKNAEIVEAAREAFSFAMDNINRGTPYTGATVHAAFLPVAKALEIDTTFWEPMLKSLTLQATPDGKE